MGGGENGFREFDFSNHAMHEMQRRGIDIEMVRATLAEPEQTQRVQSGRIVMQSRIERHGGRYLLRVFVDIDRPIPVVVTAYLTSKIGKYWSDEP
jgi:hypothetical protein